MVIINEFLPDYVLMYMLYSTYSSAPVEVQCLYVDTISGLERGPLSLMSTIKELLERKSSGSSLEIREYVHRDLLRWPRGILYPQKLAPTSLTIGGHLVGIVLSRTQATEEILISVRDWINRRA
jgi:hypothetical protein